MEKRTSFNPVTDGFQFPNRFKISGLIPINLTALKLPALNFAPLNNLIYGLCGGMCYAVLDYKQDHKPIPAETNPDNIAGTLFHFLLERELESLPLPVLGQLFAWINMDDKTIGEKTKDEEIPKIMTAIDLDQPAALVLIRTSGGENPTNNHQVLATGYNTDGPAGDIILYLYDPNFPGRESQMMVKPHADGLISISEVDVLEQTRGFFVSPYKYHQPE